jgi:HAD superfamily hydrolase (TIGR01484 family)
VRYHALATDYDGTLAHNGRVDAPTVEALKQLLATGRRLILVSGRELPELLEIFPEIELFEMVVVENGALLYRPSTKHETALAEVPPAAFVEALRAAGVGPISVGRAIVATWEPHEQKVLETIRDMGLELQVIFNKGAVMVLPAGVNKASGMLAGLKAMGLSPHNTVGVGDAENDHSFLRLCELAAAVANALPAVKDTADFVTQADHGAGVAQLIEAIVADDLAGCQPRLRRHDMPLGTSEEKEISLDPYGSNILICGASGSGKSTVAARIVEMLQESNYQFCLFDPEGDYESLEGAVVFGGPKVVPLADEVVRLLDDPFSNVVVCMTGMKIPDRPPFFLELLSEMLEKRAKTGRPHWLLLDEAHHLLPADWAPPAGLLPADFTNLLLITVHPDLLSPALLERINIVLAVGAEAATSLQEFAKVAAVNMPVKLPGPPEEGQILMWMRNVDPPVKVVRPYPSQLERRRHRRKYAEGELAPDRSFYFRGREGKLNLRAQNLMLFLQLGEGVDDETWNYHLAQGDYSRWFREGIKDDNLAEAAERIEKMPNVAPDESRALIRAAVERDYTLPASSALPVPGAH